MEINGALQGLNKEESKKVYGEEQVKLWRRSSNVRPPEVAEDDERFPGNDPKYKDIDKTLLPKTENLNDTIVRVEELRLLILSNSIGVGDGCCSSSYLFSCEVALVDGSDKLDMYFAT